MNLIYSEESKSHFIKSDLLTLRQKFLVETIEEAFVVQKSETKFILALHETLIKHSSIHLLREPLCTIATFLNI